MVKRHNCKVLVAAVVAPCIEIGKENDIPREQMRHGTEYCCTLWTSVSSSCMTLSSEMLLSIASTFAVLELSCCLQSDACSATVA